MLPVGCTGVEIDDTISHDGDTCPVHEHDPVQVTGETIDVTPNWVNMRKYVLRVATSDLRHAMHLAYHMGSEAPTLREICEATGLDDGS